MSSFKCVWKYSCIKLARTDQIFSVGMDEKRSLQRKVNTRDESVARIMNSAALKKQELQDALRRATRTVAKRVEK